MTIESHHLQTLPSSLFQARMITDATISGKSIKRNRIFQYSKISPKKGTY